MAPELYDVVPVGRTDFRMVVMELLSKEDGWGPLCEALYKGG